MNWTSPEILIAIYAAGLSTFIFIWRLVEKYNETKGQIEIKMLIMTQFPLKADRTLGQHRVILTFKIVNKGKQGRYIDRIALELNKETERGKYLQPINLEDQTKYPILIGPGEIFEPFLDLDGLRKSIAETDFKKARRIRAYTKDTFGKNYKSNWMTLDELMGKSN